VSVHVADEEEEGLAPVSTSQKVDGVVGEHRCLVPVEVDDSSLVGELDPSLVRALEVAIAKPAVESGLRVPTMAAVPLADEGGLVSRGLQ